MNLKKLIYLSAGLFFFFSSCARVMPHQRIYLNQENMELNTKTIEKAELNFQSYREGASGANGGKVGGGCGCN